MCLEDEQRAGARRSGRGENARPTHVQGQFIPPWFQQASAYPEVPANERATAWLLTETYQSGKDEPAVMNDPHHPQREYAGFRQLSDDRCLLATPFRTRASRRRWGHVARRCSRRPVSPRQSPRQSATITFTAHAPCVGATAVAAPSVTVAFAAKIPPKYTCPDCPPVQP